MTRRTYGQYCGLALGLDAVGERWTLLIVRELMAGPKRYSDLQNSLDGIGTSLLASRLRQLEQENIIFKRKLPRPSASLVYQLSESGQQLAQALLPLALWGVRYQAVSPRGPSDAYRAEWPLVFIAQMVDRRRAADANLKYLFRIDDSCAVMLISDGQVHVTEASSDERGVDLTITTDASVLVDVSAGRSTISEAVASGRFALDGDQDAADQLIDMLPERITTGSEYQLR